MNVRVAAAALEDMEAAADHYDRNTPGTGARFLRAVKATLNDISHHPEAWAEIAPGIRRRNVNGFPYAVIYRTVGDEVQVGCVMHGRRRPDFWKSRFPG